MEPGSEIGDVTRGLMWRRIAWEWIAALCALGFLFIAAGTSISLFEPGYVFGEGELPGLVGVLVGTAALAIVALSRIWAGDRRAEALLAELGAGKWLPSPDAREGETGAAFEAETTRLGTLGRRAVLIAVLWGWVLAACLAGLAAADRSSGAGFPIGILVLPLLFTFFAVPWSLLAAFRWRRRYLAVRRTGWYRAAVTVLPEQSRGGRRPDVHVRYPDGSVIALHAVPAIDRMRKLADRPNRRAWIGGWGRDMVVLFPPGPLGDRSHPIPAYSVSPREDG